MNQKIKKWISFVTEVSIPIIVGFSLSTMFMTTYAKANDNSIMPIPAVCNNKIVIKPLSQVYYNSPVITFDGYAFSSKNYNPQKNIIISEIVVPNQLGKYVLEVSSVYGDNGTMKSIGLSRTPCNFNPPFSTRDTHPHIKLVIKNNREENEFKNGISHNGVTVVPGEKWYLMIQVLDESSSKLVTKGITLPEISYNKFDISIRIFPTSTLLTK